jgi:Lipopolysaccharide-assembly
MPALRSLSLCLAGFLLAGCAGYKLGPTNGLRAGARTIQVNPFSNQTFEPRLGDTLTAALRRELQRDGTYRLSTHGGADVIVSGVVTHYVRRELSLVPRDVLTVRDFQIIGQAQVIARDAASGRILLDRSVSGHALVRVGSDLTSAERQAMPELAEDLARRATGLLVDGSW